MIYNIIHLLEPAWEAGIDVPADPFNFDMEQFPHFELFCMVQLGLKIPYYDAEYNNAKVISSIHKNDIMNVSFNDLINSGLAVGEWHFLI